MPLYLFKNPKTSKTVEILQSMKEEHVFIDDDGLEWERVWLSPNTAIDTEIDPFSETDFVDKTKSKNSTVGDLWDQSRELGEKRAKIHGGEDPVNKKYDKNYSKKRKGMKRPPTH